VLRIGDSDSMSAGEYLLLKHRMCYIFTNVFVEKVEEIGLFLATRIHILSYRRQPIIYRNISE